LEELKASLATSEESLKKTRATGDLQESASKKLADIMAIKFDSQTLGDKLKSAEQLTIDRDQARADLDLIKAELESSKKAIVDNDKVIAQQKEELDKKLQSEASQHNEENEKKLKEAQDETKAVKEKLDQKKKKYRDLIDEKDKHIKGLNDRIEDKKGIIEGLEEEIETFKTNLHDTEKKLKEAQDETKAVKEKLDQKKKKYRDLIDEKDKHIKGLNDRIEDKKGIIEGLEEEIETFKTNLHDTEKKLKEAQDETKAVKEKLDQKKKKYRDLIDEKDKHIKGLNDRIEDKKGIIEGLEEEIETFKTNLHDTEKKLHDERDQVKALTEKCETKKTMIKELEKQLEEEENKTKDHQAKFESEEARVKEAQKQLEDERDKSKTLRDKYEARKTKIKELEKQVDDEENRTKDLQSKIVIEEERVSRIQQELDDEKARSKGFDQKLSDMDEEIRKLTDKLNNAESENDGKDTLSGQITDLKKQLAAALASIAKLQGQLKEATEAHTKDRADLEGNKTAIETLKHDLQTKEKALADLATKSAGETEAARQAAELLQHQLDARSKEKSDMAHEIESFKTENTEMKEKIEKTAHELKIATEGLKLKLEELAAEKTAKEELEKQSKNMAEMVEQLNQEAERLITEAGASQRASEDGAAALKAELEASHQETSKLEQHVKEATEELKKLKLELQEKTAELAAATEELQKLQKSVDSLNNLRDEHLKEIEKLQLEVKIHTGESNELALQVADLSKQLVDANHLVKSKDQELADKAKESGSTNQPEKTLSQPVDTPEPANPGEQHPEKSEREPKDEKPTDPSLEKRDDEPEKKKKKGKRGKEDTASKQEAEKLEDDSKEKKHPEMPQVIVIQPENDAPVTTPMPEGEPPKEAQESHIQEKQLAEETHAVEAVIVKWRLYLEKVFDHIALLDFELHEQNAELERVTREVADSEKFKAAQQRIVAVLRQTVRGVKTIGEQEDIDVEKEATLISKEIAALEAVCPRCSADPVRDKLLQETHPGVVVTPAPLLVEDETARVSTEKIAELQAELEALKKQAQTTAEQCVNARYLEVRARLLEEKITGHIALMADSLHTYSKTLRDIGQEVTDDQSTVDLLHQALAVLEELLKVKQASVRSSARELVDQLKTDAPLDSPQRAAHDGHEPLAPLNTKAATEAEEANEKPHVEDAHSPEQADLKKELDHVAQKTHVVEKEIEGRTQLLQEERDALDRALKELSAKEVDAGRLKEAHEQLKAICESLPELRTRSPRKLHEAHDGHGKVTNPHEGSALSIKSHESAKHKELRKAEGMQIEVSLADPSPLDRASLTEAEIKSLSEKLEAGLSRLRDAAADVHTKKEEETKLRLQLEKLGGNIAQHQGESEATAKEIKQLTADLAEVKADVGAREQLVKHLQEAAACARTLKASKAVLDSCEASIKAAERLPVENPAPAELPKEEAVDPREIQDKREQLSHLEQQTSEKSQELGSKVTEVEDLKKKIEEEIEKDKDLGTKIDAVHKNIDSLKSKLASLKDSTESRKGKLAYSSKYVERLAPLLTGHSIQSPDIKIPQQKLTESTLDSVFSKISSIIEKTEKTTSSTISKIVQQAKTLHESAAHKEGSQDLAKELEEFITENAKLNAKNVMVMHLLGRSL
jgi:chromosome segregation ATPase